MRSVGERSVFLMNPSVNYQPVGDGAVILRFDDGQLFTCNATFEAFLRHVDGNRTLEEIAALLCEEFDVDSGTVTGDLIEIAGELVEEGIIRLASEELTK
ncbi:PqqD family protein [Chelativorans sp. Marseille-P2723]|uniref:PqqD family protein n=1 Tax=Chelativorans sp. Marseille-P2723 TaxID=2709133 RepID=UPI00156EC1D4|nr:PqqD family protein [Chelativorans sp. Marseille-P2723]